MTPTMAKQDLKTLLKRMRDDRRLTQRDVADGVTEHGGQATDRAVSLWEKGDNISYRNARALADFFDAPELLVAAGYEPDEFETMRAELARYSLEVAEVKQMLLDLRDQIPDS